MNTRRMFLIGSAATIGAAAPGLSVAAALPNLPSLVPAITLGIAGPLTGNDRNLGLQLANGMQQAIYEANQVRGSFDAHFAVRTFDDQNLLAQAVSAAQFAVDDSSVICIVGHLSGRGTEAALRTYTNASMPVIIPASTYEKLTAYGYASVLRLPTKDSSEGRLAAAYILKERKPASAAVIFQDGDYGFDVADGIVKQLGPIPCQSVKCSWEKPDFSAAVQRALDTTPDCIFLAGSVADMGNILKALRTANYAKTLVASQGFFSAATIDSYAADAEGLIVSSSIPPFQLAPADLSIIQDFRQNYGAFTPLAALAYAGTQIAIAAIQRTGARNRLDLWRALQNPTTYDTVIGTFSFLANGDQVDPNVYFYEVKDGKWSYLRSAHPTTFLAK
jgi:branched-chain amino acid transport system substrate-binding protein